MNQIPKSPTLEIKALSARYGGQSDYALKDVSFDLHSGEILGIIGANGAGKSTLIKAILGLIPASGQIKIFGGNLAQVRQKLAYIPQRKDIDWDFPVCALDICLMGMYPRIGWLRRIKAQHKEEALSYLRQVELEDFAMRPIGALSGGQQQRVFMARALAQKAELIILDEPFAGIDQKTQETLFNILKNLKSDGKSIMIVHHNLQAASKHFDRVVLLNKSLIALGEPKDVMTQENIGLTYGNWVA